MDSLHTNTLEKYVKHDVCLTSTMNHFEWSHLTK